MTPEEQAGERWAILARLVRPQGRHGEILADILTDFPARFADRKRLFLLSSEISPGFLREVALDNHWLHKGRIVLKLAGVDSISDADKLRGLLVAIPRSERAALEDDSVYIGDLIGCEIIDVSGTPARIGVVTDFDSEAGLLQVKTPGGEEALVPFAKAYLKTVDLAGKRIEMHLPKGLLEINAPMTNEECRAMEQVRDGK